MSQLIRQRHFITMGKFEWSDDKRTSETKMERVVDGVLSSSHIYILIDFNLAERKSMCM